MNPVSRITRWAATWAGLAWLLLAARRSSRARRADREWAAGITQRVHDRRYLDWLEQQFARDESDERRT